jgi:hypothetical protein
MVPRRKPQGKRIELLETMIDRYDDGRLTGSGL